MIITKKFRVNRIAELTIKNDLRLIANCGIREDCFAATSDRFVRREEHVGNRARQTYPLSAFLKRIPDPFTGFGTQTWAGLGGNIAGNQPPQSVSQYLSMVFESTTGCAIEHVQLHSKPLRGGERTILRSRNQPSHISARKVDKSKEVKH